MTPASPLQAIRRGGRFALTSGYRRTNKLGAAVLYGIVLGFVLYVAIERMGLFRPGCVFESAFAAARLVLAGVGIGLTVLVYREDGRA
jgi:lipopolysaccharide export system permease protein